MKTSNIVKVNINNIPPAYGININNNAIAAVIIVSNIPGVNSDTTWMTFAEIENTSEPEVLATAKTINDTFTQNGGGMLLFKRLHAITSGNLVTSITEAAETLEPGIINIQLAAAANRSGTAAIALNNTDIVTIANNLFDASSQEDNKIIFVTSNLLPSAGLNGVSNVFYQYVGTANHSYESVAALAYYTNIDYRDTIIKDYEYTNWNGPLNENSLVDELPDETGGKVNIFTNLANRVVLVGGYLTNGVRLHTLYFEIVMSQKIATVLVELLLNKIEFNAAGYAAMYNAVSAQLDVFASNNVLDLGFISPDIYTTERNNVRFELLKIGEPLIDGYKVIAMPASKEDLANRTYTGLIIYVAMNNQIREIEVNGLVIGGV